MKRGLALHPNRDVILLNSDVLVSNDWIYRIIAHADADAKIATITPLSNNAIVCSYPQTNRANMHALEVPLAETDQMAAASNRLSRNELPSGVGVCFFMRRSVIDEIGNLDEKTSGRGYGEENDFCMRALMAGYKNVLAHDIIVFHIGDMSFSDSALALRKVAEMRLNEKHPDYNFLVQDYIARDPSRKPRAQLDAARLARAIGPKQIVFITHNWGGGIEKHISDLQQMIERENVRVVVLRAGGRSRQQISVELTDSPDELYLPNIGQFDILKDRDFLSMLLDHPDPRLIHIHSVAGLSPNATEVLFNTLKESKRPYVYTWHDFSPLCHRNHFLSVDRKYCGEPDISICRNCLALDNGTRNEFEPSERRRVFGSFLAEAAGIIAPSTAAALRAVKLTSTSILIRPHPEEALHNSWIHEIPPEELPRKIALIGGIGPHKSSDLLIKLLRDADRRQLPLEFLLVGHSDQQELKAPKTRFTETGRYYEEADAVRRVQSFKPHFCFYPSIISETYSYTLSLALSLGVPPIVFDLGAQAERVKAAGWGEVLPVDLLDNPCAVNDRMLMLSVSDAWAKRRKVDVPQFPGISKYYGIS